MIRNILAVAWKELQVLLQDRGSLAVLFLLPLVLASIFGSMNQSVTDAIEGEEAVAMPVYLVNLDDGPYGEQIEAILGDIGALEITTLDTDEGVDQLVADGEEIAAIIIPADFSAKVNSYTPTRVRVIVDPTQESGGMISGMMNEVLSPIVLQGEIQYGIRSVLDASGMFEDVDPQLRRAIEAQSLGVIMTQLQQMQENPWIAVKHEDPEGVETRDPWNPFSYLVPSFTVMFSFFLVSTVAQSIWREKEQGSFRRLMAAPVHRGTIIAGKILAYMLVVCLQVLVLFTVGNTAFDMPLGDSPLGLLLLTLALALTATSLGILVATLSRTSRQADTIGTVLAFVLAALGGCIAYPIFMLDGVIGAISHMTPHSHAIEGFMYLMNEGAGLVDILPQIGVLAGFGVVFFIIGMWRFRFE